MKKKIAVIAIILFSLTNKVYSGNEEKTDIFSPPNLVLKFAFLCAIEPTPSIEFALEYKFPNNFAFQQQLGFVSQWVNFMYPEDEIGLYNM